MTEHDDAHEHDEVRRLLSAAGGPTPALPPEVGARLDDVLAGLVAERAEAAGDGQPGGDPEPLEVASVTELAPRRHRRWPRILVAAAAVSVVGIGIGNVVGGGVMSGSDSGGTALTAESADSENRPVPSEPEAAADRDSPPNASQDQAGAPKGARELTGALDSRPMRLRRSSLTVDVQRVVDFGLAAAVADTPRRWADACVRPSTGAGDEWLPVRLDGDPGVLVLRAPADGRRTAEVFTCGDADTPAASTTADVR